MIIKQLGLIRGLQYYRNFVTENEKNEILAIIDGHKWCDRLMRKQQYYGIKYYQTKIEDHILQPNISTDHYPLHLFQFLIDKSIQKYRLFQENYPPNQILINRYVKSDKLGMHVQDVNAFGEIILGVSLGSKDYLRLNHINDKQKVYLLQLQDRSCYILKDDARHKYRHGIGRVINNIKYKDQHFERISLTIRHVIDNRRKLQIPQQHKKLQSNLKQKEQLQLLNKNS